METAIAAVSHRNLYGETTYRAIWSQDVQHWACGWWSDYDDQGILIRHVFEPRYVPKYHFAPRWIMEKWHPPEFFGTPEQWEQITAQYSAQHGKILELGPYPSEGAYVFLWKCEDVDGKYLELTPTMAQYTVELDLQPPPTLDQLIADAENRERKHRESQRALVIDECMDAFPFLGRVTNLNSRSLMDKIRTHNKERS